MNPAQEFPANLLGGSVHLRFGVEFYVNLMPCLQGVLFKRPLPPLDYRNKHGLVSEPWWFTKAWPATQASESCLGFVGLRV